MSEFGKGYAYCLGLFLAHTERNILNYKPPLGFSLWFNGAADHLFELEIPETLDEPKKAEIQAFKAKCLKFKMKDCTQEDVNDAVATVKRLLLEWDQHNNIAAERGDWE